MAKEEGMDLIGKTIGDYRIIAQIGRGGTAFVFRAWQLSEDRIVALKILRPHQAELDNFAERFAREARILGQLDHPNILPIRDFGQAQEYSYIATKYIDGGTLKARLAEESLSLDDMARVITQIAAALDHAHQRGILHRDIKPSNIMLDKEEVVYLTDFGLTKVLSEEEDLTLTGMGLGTPTYISPEQGQGHAVDHHTDLYSLGIILYQMLTGEPPFKAKSPMGTIFKHIHSPPRSPLKHDPDLPAAVEAVIYKALAKLPTERYHSGQALAQAFWKAISDPDDSTTAIVRHISAKRPETGELVFPSASGNNPSAAADALVNLPLPSTPFIGRSEQLTEIIAQLTDFDCRLLNLVGAGGIGKTRLAIQAARQLAAATSTNQEAPQPTKVFAHGITFVSLSPLNAAEQIVPAIAEALQLRSYVDQNTSQDLKQQLFNFLREKNLLLILDNFEHLVAGVDLLTEIITRAPHVKILTTSRDRLHLQDEWVLEIAGLDYPLGKRVSISNLEDYEAIQLFLQNVRRTHVGYTIPPSEVPYLIRICQLVEGMPLGLELAASWTRMLTCREVAQEIEKNFDFLETAARDIPERHQSLRIVFDYSWQLLTADEQTLFRQLSFFRGGFSREAAAYVVGASLTQLSGLMDKSLLRRTPTGRYQIHEALRQFVATKLQEAPQIYAATEARHAQYYADFLHQREPHFLGQRQRHALEEIGQEIENIQLAWRWIIEYGQTEIIGQAIGSLYHFYIIRSWFQEGVETFGRAAARTQEIEGMMHDFKPGPGTIFSRLLARQGRFYYRLRDYGKARELLQKSIAISEFLDAQAETAFSLNSLGNVAYRLGEIEEAQAHYEESLSIYRTLHDQSGIAVSLSNLGVVIHELGGKAKPLFEESLIIFKSLGDQWNMAQAMGDLGMVALASGQYDEAEKLYTESLTICQEIDDQYGIARAVTHLGDLAYAQGDYDDAEKLYQESIDIFDNIGDQLSHATSMAQLGKVARAQSQFTKAKTLFERSLSMCQQLDNQHGIASALNQLGRIAYETEAFAEARQYYQESLEIYFHLGHHWGIVTALCDLGYLNFALADYNAAKHYFIHALQTTSEINALPQMLNALVGIATLLAETGDGDRAVSLLAAIDGHLADNKALANQAQLQITQLKTLLSAKQFETAWHHGQTLSIERLVASILAWELSPAANTKK